MDTHGDISREILISFWKVHILHHAAGGPVAGSWMMKELRRHGYEVSPGTLYPILNRMERRGWLRCEADPKRGPRGRKDYRLTPRGGEVLDGVKLRLRELFREVMRGSGGRIGKRRVGDVASPVKVGPSRMRTQNEEGRTSE